MTTELLARFQQLLQEHPANALIASTDMLLQQMSPEAARLLRLCAIPHQFNRELLRVVEPTLSSEEATSYCEEFSRLALVCPVEENLALHDQVRQYLFTSWLDPSRREELSAVSALLVEHFTRAKEEATGERLEWLASRKMFHLLGVDQEQGMDEFERLFRQWRHAVRLAGCITLCSLVHEYDPLLTRRNVIRLAYQEGKLQADRRQWDRAERLLRQVLDEEGVPSSIRFKTFSRLGMVFAEQRQWSTAIGVLHQALELARAEPESHHPVHRVLHELGVVHRDSGDLEEAARLLSESVALAEQRKEFFDLAVAYNSLGELYRRQGRLRQAIAMYEKSLKYLECIGERSRCAQVYSNLGMSFADLRDWRTAEHFFLRSLETGQQTGDILGQARTLNNLTRVYQNLKQSQRALEVCLRAIDLFTSIREDYGTGWALWNQAKLYGAQRQHELARQAYSQAIEAFTRTHATIEAAQARQELESPEHRKGLSWWWWLSLVIFALMLALSSLAVMSLLLSQAK